MPVYISGNDDRVVIHEKRTDGSPCGGEGAETHLSDPTPPPKRWFICRKCGEQFWRRRDDS